MLIGIFLIRAVNDFSQLKWRQQCCDTPLKSNQHLINSKKFNFNSKITVDRPDPNGKRKECKRNQLEMATYVHTNVHLTFFFTYALLHVLTYIHMYILSFSLLLQFFVISHFILPFFKRHTTQKMPVSQTAATNKQSNAKKNNMCNIINEHEHVFYSYY